MSSSLHRFGWKVLPGTNEDTDWKVEPGRVVLPNQPFPLEKTKRARRGTLVNWLMR